MTSETATSLFFTGATGYIGSALVRELVADGTAELGVSFLSELVAIKGVAIAGPLPTQLQNYTDYAAAVPTASKAPAQAGELIAAFIRPDADAIWRAAGLEPARK